MSLLRSVSNMKYLFVADCVIVTSQYNALLNGTLFWNGIQEPYTTLFYRFFILANVPFYRIPSRNGVAVSMYKAWFYILVPPSLTLYI